MPEKRIVHPIHIDRIGEGDFILDRHYKKIPLVRPFDVLTPEIIAEARNKSAGLRAAYSGRPGGFRYSLEQQEKRGKFLGVPLPGWKDIGPIALSDELDHLNDPAEYYRFL